jgi:pimeloyl-ACP methyl ester carboxylesterase
MRILLAILALVLLGIPIAAFITARMSLNPDTPHARETRALPFITKDPRKQPDGLIQVQVKDLTFRARVAGLNNSGPNLLLLHGFPETTIMWDRLITAASSAGFRVVAFDQRGYSPDARPTAVEDYALPILVDDVRAIADRFGFDRFHLVGHDWGSVVGWNLTSREPERVLSWTSLSIPHLMAVISSQEDPKTPAYIQLFQQPGIPETLMLAFNQLFMKRVLYRGIHREHVDEYLRVFTEPGAMTAAFNWYRMTVPDYFPGKVSQPVLYIWGNRDLPVFVNPDVQAAHPQFLLGPFESIELSAGHWLIQEEPDRVVDAVMTHLKRQPDSIGM